ncbi:MAG: hypothetical protein CSB28_02280, partial [Desulfobacterales bacterium]
RPVPGCTIRINKLGRYDDVSFEYDANGNMIKKTAGSVVTSYVYNIEDRLTEVWNEEAGTGSLTASYYYDPFGRRLWKEVGGVQPHFHYTYEGLIGEYDAAGNELRRYGYKPESTWTTDPLFMEEAGQYYFYHNDHLGTPQKLTAVNGAVVWSALYSSFGEATINVAVVENPLRFPGQYFDQETGLNYNHYRYYNPEQGRFLRKDPVGINGGINLYRFVKNNPLSLIDVHGLFCVTLIDVTIPLPAILVGSDIKNEGEWKRLSASPDFYSLTFGSMIGIALEVIFNPEFKYGIAHCVAIKKIICESKYEREGLRVTSEYCASECGFNSWGNTEKVLLKQYKSTDLDLQLMLVKNG